MPVCLYGEGDGEAGLTFHIINKLIEILHNIVQNANNYNWGIFN